MAKDESWRGKIGKMSEAEKTAFLKGASICRLGCLDDAGWPYVVPVWHEYADGGFYLVPRARCGRATSRRTRAPRSASTSGTACAR